MSRPTPPARAWLQGRGASAGAFGTALICSSMASVISGDALPAYSGLYLKPFQMGGLWLAVIMTAPPACRSTMLYVTVGVGAGLSQRNVATPLPAAVSATVLAKSSEANRVSKPTTSPLWARPRCCMYRTTPCAQRRTLSKVKSSAMMARQPSVPNLMDMGWLSLLRGCFSERIRSPAQGWRRATASFPCAVDCLCL